MLTFQIIGLAGTFLFFAALVSSHREPGPSR
jgi:hypothetical protein